MTSDRTLRAFGMIAGVISFILTCAAFSFSNQPSQTVGLRITVFDYTERRPIRGTAEVWLRGSGSWYPDLRQGGDIRTFEGREVGALDSIFWYPEGRDYVEIIIPIRITDEMCPQGCARDAIELEVWDDRYEAFGAPHIETIEMARP